MTMMPRHILLVEDDPRDLELTLTAFAEHKVLNEVVVVRDGVEALDYLFRRGEFAARPEVEPAFVLLDLKMPRLNGIEVLGTMKADDRLRMIPVIMLTSSRESRDLEECYRLGANAYVVKPVHFDEFIRAVRDLGMFWALVNEPPPISQGPER